MSRMIKCTRAGLILSALALFVVHPASSQPSGDKNGGAPPGLYNPNCNGAADCGIVKTPVTPKTNLQAKLAAQIAAAFPGTTTCNNAASNPGSVYMTFTIVNSNGKLFVRMGPGGPLYPAKVTKNPDGSYTFAWTETAPPTGQGSWTGLPIPPGGNPWSVTLTPTGAGTWSVTPSNPNWPVICTSSN